jgi:hypothetical protein
MSDFSFENFTQVLKYVKFQILIVYFVDTFHFIVYSCILYIYFRTKTRWEQVVWMQTTFPVRTWKLSTQYISPLFINKLESFHEPVSTESWLQACYSTESWQQACYRKEKWQWCRQETVHSYQPHKARQSDDSVGRQRTVASIHVCAVCLHYVLASVKEQKKS